ncbi:ankyrin repeat-containing domain protein [Pelagophyceae sp. CCMP2097]|nr:ankyrin repeat-containing domain protein [Pelagophyceae sp. CCMP2097]
MADDPSMLGDDDFEDEVVKVDPATHAPDLFLACKRNDVGATRSYLEQGVPQTFHEGAGWTCLHWAARWGAVESVERLVEDGAAVPYLEAKAAASRPPALRQASDERFDAVGASASEDGQSAPKGAQLSAAVLQRNTPLHWAAFHGHLRVVWLLLGAGYAADDADEVGNSALHLGAAGGHPSIVRALVAAGAKISAQNLFSNTPLDVSTVAGVREMLVQAHEAETKLENESKKLEKESRRKLSTDTVKSINSALSVKQASHMLKYQAVAAALEGAMLCGNLTDISKLHTAADILDAALSAARLECVDASLVLRGDGAADRLGKHIALRDHLDLVRAAAPIVTQEAYTALVNKLARLRREAAELAAKRDAETPKDHDAEPLEDDDAAAPVDDDCGAPEALLQEADNVVARSHAEFWLKSNCAPLDAKPCADAACQRPMDRLAAAIAEAEARRADAELLNSAKNLLARFAAELQVRQAMDAVPAVKLPILDAPPDYWLPDDFGAVEETEDFPAPPEDGVYVWIPAVNLSALRTSADRLEKAVAVALQSNAFADLVQAAQAAHKTVSDGLKQLERKDDEDREIAVAAAEKAAKKLKKAKGGGGKKKKP